MEIFLKIFHNSQEWKKISIKFYLKKGYKNL